MDTLTASSDLFPPLTEETPVKEGRLKVFLGMCAGVGKTYAMLQEAQKLMRDGADVVVALAETHQRAETEALLKGLSALPRRQSLYRGIILEDMDLDAVLSRRPPVAIVDELAHTNIPGSRHPKRYQDILELLRSGISVLTTVNVQHLESRADVVHQITGAPVPETVPDSILERADAIQLVDLTPEALRERLSEGKVYLGEAAGLAADNFFKLENLTALREMALRVAAEHADNTLRDVMRNRGIPGPWKAAERLLVCVGLSPSSENLIRWTKRMAGALDCSWMAVYVETDGGLDEGGKQRLGRYLSLARQLGAETLIIPGLDAAPAIVRLAREHNVTQIIVGKTHEPAWRTFFQGGSLAQKLIRRSGMIDVNVVQADKTTPLSRKPGKMALPYRPADWISAGAITAILTLFFYLLKGPVGYTAIAPLYLLWVVVAGLKYPRWIVLCIAACCALLWDFLFIPPTLTLAINSFQDLSLFLMLFVVAVALGNLTTRLRSSERAREKRERRTSALFDLIEQAALAPDLPQGLEAAVRLLANLLHCRLAITVRQPDRTLAPEPHPASSLAVSAKERSVAEWVLSRGLPAGRGTDTLTGADSLHLPLKARTGVYGVLSVQPSDSRVFDPEERDLLEASAGLIAAILEKDHIIEAFKHAEVVEASDRLRRALLDSVSHELKTPLATLQTGMEAVLYRMRPESATDQETVAEIRAALRRLRRIIENLLDMTRIQAGVVRPRLDWSDPEEIIRSAVELAGEVLDGHSVKTEMDGAIPLVKVDQALVEQALSNLVSNAAAWSPPGSSITIQISYREGQLALSVLDEGPGLSPSDIKRAFEKFYRGPNAPTGGTGLGLSIVEGFVRAHGGNVSAANREEKGACFTMRLPAEALTAPTGEPSP